MNQYTQAIADMNDAEIRQAAINGELIGHPYYSTPSVVGLRDRDDWHNCWVSFRPDTWAGPPVDDDGQIVPPAPIGEITTDDAGNRYVAVGDGYTKLRIPSLPS